MNVFEPSLVLIFAALFTVTVSAQGLNHCKIV
jgi:hypothetical protein